MSEETYYTVLYVKETASSGEIKTAYRDLIKQVHPDTIDNLAPYLRQIAADKAKEITEAYGVLSNSSKRRDYDEQLAAYRRRTSPQASPAPQAPPTPPPQQPSRCPICGRSDGGHSVACAASTSPGPYCRTCGTSLYSSGFCPKCNKYAVPAATPSRSATSRPQPKVIRRFGYNWGPLLDWAGEHPIMVVLLFILVVFSIGALFSDANTSQSTKSKPQPFTNKAAAASTGPYSAYPCDSRDKVSPIDGKPCSERQNQSVPAPPPGFAVEDKTGAQSPTPTVLVSGRYAGIVHNQTASTDDKKGGAQFGSFDGSWEGDLIFLQGATLSQKDQTTVRYRISIQGMKVRVFVVRAEDVKEIKRSKFHVNFLMTNAVVYAMESGHDNEGTWVETWVFTLTQIDKDTVLTNFSRMVNNLDLPLASDHSKFAKEAAGKLRRISDDTAGMIPGSGQSQGYKH